MKLVAYNHVFALLFSMPHFNSLKLFWPKNTNFRALGALLQTSVISAAGSSAPTPSKQLPLQISGYAPGPAPACKVTINMLQFLEKLKYDEITFTLLHLVPLKFFVRALRLVSCFCFVLFFLFFGFFIIQECSQVYQ